MPYLVVHRLDSSESCVSRCSTCRGSHCSKRSARHPLHVMERHLDALSSSAELQTRRTANCLLLCASLVLLAYTERYVIINCNK